MPSTITRHPSVQPPPQVQCRRRTCTANCRAIDFSFISSACACCSATAAAASPAKAPPLDTPLSAWAVAASHGQLTPDGNISRVDAHTGFILAALLCALVGALSLISLLRCWLHYCGRRRAVLPAAAGLKKRVLRRMPVAVYEAAAAAAEGGGAECAICLGELEDGDAVRLLPRCRHGFHVHCIDTWLSTHSSCPICRDSLLDESATAAAAAGGGEETATGWMSPEFAAAMLILP